MKNPDLSDLTFLTWKSSLAESKLMNTFIHFTQDRATSKIIKQMYVINVLCVNILKAKIKDVLNKKSGSDILKGPVCILQTKL